MLEGLIQGFTMDKKRTPSNVNELLDYIQKCYIHGEISISEYKKFFNELDKNKAEKPQSYMIRNKPFDRMNIPG